MPVDKYIVDLKAAIHLPELPGAVAACEKAARAMGLVHALRDFGLFRMEQPVLLSPRRRRLTPNAARQFAGTEDAVFCYVGPPVLDRERAGALVFRAGIEADRVVAVPWDSGGLHRRRARHLTGEDRKALLRNRTMPAPDYRRALAATMLLRFGGEPARYLRSELLEATDPDGVCDGTPASFTYEARFPGRLVVQTTELALVVVRRENLSEGLHRLRTWCGEHQVPFEIIDERSRNRTVREAVLNYGLGLLT